MDIRKLLLLALGIRIVWALGLSDEYWGDADHNRFMVTQTFEAGEYTDYKDRHLVWLPIYRWASLAVESVPIPIPAATVPFLFQLAYMALVWRWTRKTLPADDQPKALALLLLWPLPVIFSGFNMAEHAALLGVTGALTLGGPWMIVSVVVSVLSRHEATAFLALTSALLFLFGHYRKSLLIAVSIAGGLALWSLYNAYAIGDAWFWLRSLFFASSAGAGEYIAAHGWLPRVSEALFAAFLVFPFLFFGVWSLPSLKDRSEHGVMMLSAFAFLIVFVVASMFFFHGADPKYLLILSFPLSVWTLRTRIPLRTLLPILIGLIGLYMLLFHIRSYTLELERIAGRELKSLPAETVIWSDSPTVLVFADRRAAVSVSSEQIDDDADLSEALIRRRVEKIVAADWSHSRVLVWLPEMAGSAAFEKDGIRFEPDTLFAAPPVQGHPLQRLRAYAMNSTDPIRIWNVYLP